VRLHSPQYTTPNLTREDISVDPAACAGLDVLIEPV
jgi:hypothetical protein